MKKILISSVILVMSFCVRAQKEESIRLGKKEIIFSKVLKENRKIWIYTPDFTSQSVIPNKRYPVLYLLDGDAHFYSSVGIIQQLSQANGNGVLPEMIVVGIENTNRFRDFVPSSDLNKPNPFLVFLSSELIPFIDSSYKTAPYKLIVGHSLGGLIAIDMLAKFPKLFNACIAIDPSMWYANEKFLNNYIDQFPKMNMNGKRLFIGSANTLPKGMTTAQLNNDKSNETQHLRSILKFDQFLKTNTNGLLYSHKYYEKESHNTVPLLSEYDGLRYIFDYYQMDITEKDFSDTTDMIVSMFKNHYDTVSGKMGYRNVLPETFIIFLAYDALKKKHFTKSKALFELSKEWYPESSKTYVSYSDYFLTRKDTLNAILNYKKAFQVNNDSIILKKQKILENKYAPVIAISDLQKYEGTYTLVDFQLDIALVVRNGSLWSIVPGQADEELQFISENIFTVKWKLSYTITFQVDNNKSKGFTSVQPNGTFNAIRKGK